MAASRRLTRVIVDSLTASRPSSYICRSCRRNVLQTSSPSSTLHQQTRSFSIRAAVNAKSFTSRHQDVGLIVTDEITDSPETWDGLQQIGHEGHWTDIPELPSETVDLFFPSAHTKTPLTMAQLTSYLHRAIVETHICNTLNTSESPIRATDLRIEIPDSVSEALQNISVSISSTGQIAPVQVNPDLQQDLVLDNIRPEGESRAAFQDGDGDGEIEQVGYYIPADQSFLNARLDFSSPISLQILARLSQLLSHPIPDPSLNAHLHTPTSTIGTLLTSIAESTSLQPKTKLADTLLASEDLAKRSNVLILSRRETPVDREKEVGRWKVIERELRERGLPVLGRDVVV